MVGTMIDQLTLSVEWALEFNALVMATTTHPQYQLSFFQKSYPDHRDHADNLINKAFSSAPEACRKNKSNTNQCQPPVDTNVWEEEDEDFNNSTVSSNTNPAQTAIEAESRSYLTGHHKFDKKKTALDWWIVSWSLLVNFISHAVMTELFIYTLKDKQFRIPSPCDVGERLPRCFRYQLRGRTSNF